jgi:hypothetical protein
MVCAGVARSHLGRRRQKVRERERGGEGERRREERPRVVGVARG